jgi:hypothetical protein
LDWKAHKPMCPILKKLSNCLQTLDNANQIIREILSKKDNSLRILEHLLSYAEYQFGTPVEGIGHRERGGQRECNWNVDIAILHVINHRIADI